MQGTFDPFVAEASKVLSTFDEVGDGNDCGKDTEKEPPSMDAPPAGKHEVTCKSAEAKEVNAETTESVAPSEVEQNDARMADPMSQEEAFDARGGVVGGREGSVEVKGGEL